MSLRERRIKDYLNQLRQRAMTDDTKDILRMLEEEIDPLFKKASAFDELVIIHRKARNVIEAEGSRL